LVPFTQEWELVYPYHMKLRRDIIASAKNKGINPYTTPFKPSDLGLRASDYGSFSDYCDCLLRTGGEPVSWVLFSSSLFPQYSRLLRTGGEPVSWGNPFDENQNSLFRGFLGSIIPQSWVMSRMDYGDDGGILRSRCRSTPVVFLVVDTCGILHSRCRSDFGRMSKSCWSSKFLHFVFEPIPSYLGCVCCDIDWGSWAQ
jgi:hypothetical protein